MADSSFDVKQFFAMATGVDPKLADEKINKARQTLKEKTVQADKLINAFLEYTEDFANRKPKPTGYAPIDRLLGGGLLPEVYIIGAEPKIGKTTLAVQIADGMAEQGYDIIFFSQEMSPYQIQAKTCARLMSDEYPLAKSASDLLYRRAEFTEKDNKLLSNAVERYKTFAEHITIVKGHVNADDVKLAIDDYLSKHENKTDRLVVIVDYLQIMNVCENTKSSDIRRIVEENYKKLIDLKVEHTIPMIVISSLAREAYRDSKTGEIKLKAQLKESGSIEYGTGAVIFMEKDKEVDSYIKLSLDCGREIESNTDGVVVDFQGGHSKFGEVIEE